MSKHTNKVHGKLNFLIIGVVIVIGAVAYLLVNKGTLNPSELAGSGKGIKGVKKAEKYSNINEVTVELDGEEIQEVLNNQDFQKMISSGDFSKLAEDADFIKILDHDGIGIMTDIYSILEDDDIKGRRRGGDDGPKPINVVRPGGGSPDSRYIGSAGNPTNRDSGIMDGGDVEILDLQVINKVAAFQKFMKSGADFEKFQKDAAFQKFMKSDVAFEKFMKSDNYQKFMKDATLQKFMKSTNLEKFAKVSDLEKFAKSVAFQKFYKNAAFQKFMKSDNLQKFMKSSAYSKFAQKGATFEKFMKNDNLQKFMNKSEL